MQADLLNDNEGISTGDEYFNSEDAIDAENQVQPPEDDRSQLRTKKSDENIKESFLRKWTPGYQVQVRGALAISCFP